MRGRVPLGAVIAAAAYVPLLVLGLASAHTFFTPLGVSLWWPPAGLAAALLLAGGPRLLPWFTLWAVMVRTGAAAALGANLAMHWVFITTALTTVPYALAARWLHRHTAAWGFRRIRDVASFTGVMLSAAGGAALAASFELVLLERIEPAAYWHTVLNFWVGDFVAVVTLTPLCFILLRQLVERRPWNNKSASGWREDVVLPLLLGSVALLLFDSGRVDPGLMYLCLIPLVWVAVECSVDATFTAVAAVNLALVTALHDRADAAGGALELQSFLTVLAVTALGIAAVNAERVRAMSDLGRALSREQEANSRLAHAVQVQRDFVANASHELRTPLTSLVGYVELLADPRTQEAPSLTARQLRYVDVVKRNAQRMLTLIGDLLDVHLLDTERLSVKLQPTDLQPVLTEVVDELRPAADDKHIDLQLKVATVLPMVPADANRLGQLLINLGSNAVKFTEPGGTVLVTAARIGDQVRISVEDTGSGISASDLPHVFDRFYRSDSTNQLAVSGTGLGLAIAKALADAHHATLDVASVAGAGTSFTLALPVARDRAELAGGPVR